MGLRDTTLQYNLYWAAISGQPFPACSTFSPEFDPGTTEDSNIGYLTVGELESSGYTIGEYVIEWRLDSAEGITILVSGSSLAAAPDVSTVHPLVNTPILSGIIYPVVRFVDIDGVRYGSTGGYDKFAPDLKTCLSPITVVSYSCDNGSAGDYAHSIFYNNTTQETADASRTIRFDLSSDGSVDYIGLKITGEQVPDLFEFYYVFGETETFIDSYAVGSDLSGDDLNSSPKKIDYNFGTKVILDITGFIYTLGDYIKIVITPSYQTSNNNTNWSISFTCLEESMFDCNFIDSAMQQIDPCSFNMIWNPSACRYKVSFNTNGVHDTTTNEYIYGYYTVLTSSNQSVTPSGSVTNVSCYMDKNTDSNWYLEDYTGSCFNLNGLLTITKTGSDLIYDFTDNTDYLFLKNFYNDTLVSLQSGYSSDTSTIDYYRYFQITQRIQTSCGDEYINKYLGFHIDSTVIFDDINYTMTITPIQVVNGYTDGECSNVYEDIQARLNSSNMNGGYLEPDGSWVTGSFASWRGIYGQETIINTTDRNFYYGYRYWKEALDPICTSLPANVCDFNTLNYAWYLFYIRILITDELDPVNNYKVYDLVGLDGCYDPSSTNVIYEISGGVRTIPGSCP